MRTELRIIAGELKGRKLTANVHPELRPTPQMVREALFSILGNAVPDRPFIDVFAGTGILGVEALSRGASATTFVERDLKLAQEIDVHLRKFQLTRKARIYRTDAYHWAAAWRAPAEPVNVFISPPFADLSSRGDDLLQAISILQEKVADESVIVLQSERGSPLDDAPAMADWERRHYGRNVLLLWQKSDDGEAGDEEPGSDDRA